MEPLFVGLFGADILTYNHIVWINEIFSPVALSKLYIVKARIRITHEIIGIINL